MGEEKGAVNVEHNDTESFSVVLIVVAAATTAVVFAENGRETDSSLSAPIFSRKKNLFHRSIAVWYCLQPADADAKVFEFNGRR